MLSNYQIQKIIGKGTFSTVKLAIDKETSEKKAIKILEKNKIKTNRDLNRIKREIDMVKKINHLNIVKVFDIKEDEKKYYIIMEYCENGELFNLILEKHKLGEEEAAYFYFQLINGLEYIHINNIIHRDLKPENLLLTKNNILKIIDFGLSNYNTCDNLLSTPCGSPCYASPEMVSGEKYNGFTSDIWSTGIILYAMIYGYLPFENLNNNNDILFKKISECKVDYPRNSCIFALDLLKKILVPDPKERIKICDIKKHKLYLKGRSIFIHRHKNLSMYKNIGQSKEKETISENNNINRKEKKEKYQDIKNNNCYISDKKNNNIEGSTSKNIHNDNSDGIKILDNDNIIRYKNKERKDSEKINNKIINDNTNSSKKALKSFQKYPIEEIKKRLANQEEEYFSQTKKNEQKRNTYFNNIDNNIIIKDDNTTTINVELETNNTPINGSPKYKEEQKNENKMLKHKKDDKEDNHYKKVLTNLIPKLNSTTNKNKNSKIKVLPPRGTEISETKIHRKIDFPDKYPDLDANSIEYENGYVYQDFSNLKRFSPFNFHNTKNIIINIQNNNNINNLLNKRENDNIIIQNKNPNENNYINKTENYNYFNKKLKNINAKDENKKIRRDKKHSISEKKKKMIENGNYLEEIEETKIVSKKKSLDENNRTKSNINKIRGFNHFFKNNPNLKIKGIKPISIINLKYNDSFLVNSPFSVKNDFNYTFIKKDKINKKKNDIINSSQNFSINSNINQNDKNYSFNHTDENNKTTKNNKKYFYKNKINKNYNTNLTRNSKDFKNGLNNHIIFSSSYRNKHAINKSLEDKYFKNNNNSKVDNYEENVTIHKRAETNNRNIDNNIGNNYLKIISDNKEEIKPKKLKKKMNIKIPNERELKYSSLKSNIIMKFSNLKYDYKKEQKEKQIQDKDNNIRDIVDKEKAITYNQKEEGNQIKNYKDKKDNLRLTLNKIHNNIVSDDYLTKINFPNKAFNSNVYKDNYLKYNNYYNTERNEILNNNNIPENYINRNNGDNNILSNNNSLEKKENISYKVKLLNKNKKINQLNNNNEKKKNKLSINTNNIISSISKINNGNFPSITIDMNILNKNNQKYLKYYDSIKNKL